MTAEGLYPLGTPVTAYAVTWVPAKPGRRTPTASTVGPPGSGYAGNVDVLDAMVQTLRLPPDRP